MSLKSGKKTVSHHGRSLLYVLKTVSLFLIAPYPSFIQAAYSPNLRLDPAVDQLMLRLHTRYGTNLPESWYFQPMNAGEVKLFLSEAERNNLNGKFTEQETRRIRLLSWRSASSQGLLKWGDDSADRHLNLRCSFLGDIQPRFSNGVGYSDNAGIGIKGILSPSLNGNIGAVSFYSSLDVWTEFKTDSTFQRSTYQPYDGVPYNLYGRTTDSSNVRSSDIPRGGIRFTSKNISLETAIDRVKLGPSLYYPLALSGLTPPVTYGKGALSLGPVVYSHMAGLLKSQKDKPKFLYTHRLDISALHSKADIGINELIVNGSTCDSIDSRDSLNLLQPSYYGVERTWEWVYLIPFVPFKFIEHYAGDRDNAAISIDASVVVPRNFRWYGEFFLDDMSAPWKLFNNDWGNKWALTLGGNYFGTIYKRDFTAILEYSHVEPWVYTHFYGASHNFTHFGQSLGSPLGPNSQGITAAATVALNSLNTVGVVFSSIAQNKNVRGGQLGDVFQDTAAGNGYQDPITKEFLGKGTVRHLVPGITWTFNTFGLFYIDSGLSFDLTEDVVRTSAFARGGLIF